MGGSGSTTTVRAFGLRRRLQRLERAPPFSSFPKDVLRELAATAVDRMVRTGSALFHAGDAAAAAYVVDRGAVRLSATTPEGRSVVFRFAGPGDCFGLSSLLSGGWRSAEARALTDARLVIVPYPALERHVRTSPGTAAACAGYVAGRLLAERGRLTSLVGGGIRDRVASALLDLGETHGVPVAEGVLIDVPIRHEDLAGLVGSTRETVTRTLAALAKGGFVRRVGERYVVLRDRRVAPFRGA